MITKSEFYSSSSTFKTYDFLRSCGVGGNFVFNIDREAILKLLPQQGMNRILIDAPSGTGRLHPFLSKYWDIVSMDVSDGMLLKAKEKNLSKAYYSYDLLSNGSPPLTAHIVLSLRFFMHVEDIDAAFKGLSDLVMPSGFLMIDSFNWSLKNKLPFLCSYGGMIYPHDFKSLTQAADKYSLELIDQFSGFGLPPSLLPLIPCPSMFLLRKINNLFVRTLGPYSCYYLFRKRDLHEPVEG